MKKLIFLFLFTIISGVVFSQGLAGSSGGQVVAGLSESQVRSVVGDTADALRVELGGANIELNDSIPGVWGDGTHNDTQALQAYIDQVQNGTVQLYGKTYLVDSLRINYATTIQGVGYSNLTGTGGSILKTTSALPVLNLYESPSQARNDGITIKNLMILGDGSADEGSNMQTGILIKGEVYPVIDRVVIKYMGDYAIRVFEESICGMTTISNNRFFFNSKGAIYGRYDGTGVYQINGVFIHNNKIESNYGYGINLIGDHVVIKDNVIQGNDSTGIHLSGTDVNATCSGRQIIIDGNYLEANHGGDILIECYASGSIYHTFYGVEIANNYFYNTAAGITKSGINACITARRATGSDADYTIHDLHIRDNNVFQVDGGAVWVDGGSMLDWSSTIEIPRSHHNNVPLTMIINTGGAGLTMEGIPFTPATLVTTIDANGVTNLHLRPVVKVQVASPIDITANPQIVAGFEGQVIKFINTSDVNTLKFDEGTGLALTNGLSCTLGLDDVIEFKYNSARTVWVEQYRNPSVFSTDRISYIVNVTPGAALNGDSIYTQTRLIGKYIEVFKNGGLQYQNTTGVAQTVNGMRFNNTTGQIIFRPVLATNDQVVINSYSTSYKTDLALVGSEEVVNGTFTDGSAWTVDNGNTISDGVLNIAQVAPVVQPDVIAASKTYYYSLDFVLTSGTNVQLRYHNGSYQTIVSMTSTGTYTGKFTVSGTPTVGRIYVVGSDAGMSATLDNITIKEVL